MKKSLKKKKNYQKIMKSLMKEGRINDADGKMIGRSLAKNNSMTRDYFGGIGR